MTIVFFSLSKENNPRWVWKQRLLTRLTFKYRGYNDGFSRRSMLMENDNVMFHLPNWGALIRRVKGNADKRKIIINAVKIRNKWHEIPSLSVNEDFSADCIIYSSSENHTSVKSSVRPALPSSFQPLLIPGSDSQQRQFKCHWFKMPFSDKLAFITPTLIKGGFTIDLDTVISWPIVYAWVALSRSALWW